MSASSCGPSPAVARSPCRNHVRNPNLGPSASSISSNIPSDSLGRSASWQRAVVGGVSVPDFSQHFSESGTRCARSEASNWKSGLAWSIALARPASTALWGMPGSARERAGPVHALLRLMLGHPITTP